MPNDKTNSDRLTYRVAPVGPRNPSGPLTIDEESRSVDIIGATEEPTEVFDPERWEIVAEISAYPDRELVRR